MEAIPFIIFLVILFNIFRGFTKTAGKAANNTAKENMLQRLRDAQATQAANAQNAQEGDWSFGKDNNFKRNGPTSRGRERLARQNQPASPWNTNKTAAPGARVAANYLKNAQLKKSRASRKASHKNPEQHGRRGQNMDQNRHRMDGWGQRGDSDLLSGKSLVFILGVGFIVLYAMSQMPADIIK